MDVIARSCCFTVLSVSRLFIRWYKDSYCAPLGFYSVYQRDWSRDNALGFYSEGNRFECRLDTGCAE
jgi:hypothetical protein